MKKVIHLTEKDLHNIVSNAITEIVNNTKPTLNVLWLDDMRSPEKYLSSNKTSDTFLRNADFYQRLTQKYNVRFTWVHNINEFQKYIMSNGMPDLVSFDHDLGAGLEKGSECAKWLKNYCLQNKINFPKYYIHSANNNAQKLIPNELTTQTQLNELVYVNNIQGKKANLTYNTNPRNKDNKILKTDTLSTEKMDQNNDTTIEVPLKGGLMSYNITGINGTHVMHYFKKYFEGQKETIQDAGGKEYELEMLSNEFNAFMRQFKEKVWVVVNSVIKQFQQKEKGFKPVAISLYPVPSSSNFNIKMAEILQGGNIGGLPIQIISQNLFVKDLRYLELDNDFINKNKKFYNSEKFQKPTDQNKGTYIQNAQNDIEKQKKITELLNLVDVANEYSKKVLIGLYNYEHQLKIGNSPTRLITSMVENYKKFCDSKRTIEKEAVYLDAIEGNMKRIYIKGDGERGSIYQYIKSYKPASVNQRSNDVWHIVKPYLRGVVSNVDGIPYRKEDIVEFTKIGFEIKKLCDAERMALKNIYNPNTDEEFVRNEVEKTKNTVFVIFDDNIAGGATLSDVCYQAKNLGIEHIIPITFGKMTKGGEKIPINQPFDKNGNPGYNY